MSDTKKELLVTVKAKDDASSSIAKIGSSISSSMKKAGDDTEKAMKSSNDAIKNAISSMEDGVKTAAKWAAGILASTAALGVKAVKDVASLGEEIGNLTMSTGLASQVIQSLKYAGETTGVSFEKIVNGIKKMQLAEDDLRGFKAQLELIGLKSADILNIPLDQQFFKIGEAIAKLPDPTDRTIASVQMFGKTGNELLPVIGGGTAALEKFTEAAKKSGHVLSDEAIKAAQDADDAFDEFEQTVKGFSITAGETLVPILTDVLKKMTPMIEGALEWVKNHPALVESFIKWGGALFASGASLGIIVKAMESIMSLSSISKVLDAILIPLTGISALQFVALGALVGGLTYIIANGDEIYAKTRKIAESLGLVAEKSKTPFTRLGGVSDLSSVPMTISQDTGASTGGSFIQKAALGLSSVRLSISESLQGALNSIFPAFASGGRPQVGRPSIVGESGPELFVPDVSGSIIPNSRIGGQTVVVNITGNMLLSNDVATEIADKVFGVLRLQTRIT